MTFGELLRGEGVFWADTCSLGEEVRSLSYDSRSATVGSLFFCLPGAKRDGHDFAKDAYLRGCRHFVAEHSLSLPGDASVLLCGDARKKMAMLAARYYGDPARELVIIGVTGTKGKTSTALMIRDLFEAIGTPTGYIGTLGAVLDGKRFDTDGTTPESPELHGYLRLMLESGVRTVVLEVSSQGLSKHRVHAVSFDAAVFTNLSRDHIGAGEHRDMKEYREAKLSLFTECNPRLAILNAESRFSRILARRTAAERVVLFGNGRGSSYRAVDLRSFRKGNRLYTSFSLLHNGVPYGAHLSLAGAHYVEDFLAALATVSSLSGVQPQMLLQYAERLHVPGRCEVLEVPGSGLFVIDYAHNGAALRAALRGLRPHTKGRLLCLFGTVGERAECRRRDMARAASRYADFSVITEDNPGIENPDKIVKEIYAAFPDKRRALCISDRTEAIRYLLRIATPRDVVLLAGKGDEKYQLKGVEKVPFSEAEIIRRFARPEQTR